MPDQFMFLFAFFLVWICRALSSFSNTHGVPSRHLTCPRV
jgi:hypothetical protein